jgi:hypothetical protein
MVVTVDVTGDDYLRTFSVLREFQAVDYERIAALEMDRRVGIGGRVRPRALEQTAAFRLVSRVPGPNVASRVS